MISAHSPGPERRAALQSGGRWRTEVPAGRADAAMALHPRHHGPHRRQLDMVVRDHLGLIGFAQRPRAVRTPLRIRLHHAVGIGRKRARHPRVTAACLARPLGPVRLLALGRRARRNSPVASAAGPASLPTPQPAPATQLSARLAPGSAQPGLPSKAQAACPRVADSVNHTPPPRRNPSPACLSRHLSHPNRGEQLPSTGNGGKRGSIDSHMAGCVWPTVVISAFHRSARRDGRRLCRRRA